VALTALLLIAPLRTSDVELLIITLASANAVPKALSSMMGHFAFDSTAIY